LVRGTRLACAPRDAFGTVADAESNDEPAVTRDSRTPGSPRASLTIAVAQPHIVSYDVAANALTHAAVVRRADARVVVFPELSLTGYELDADGISEADPALAPIVAACAQTGSCVLAGAPVDGDDGLAYIAMLAVDGSGWTVVYRKMWLGGDDATRFSPGRAPVVLSVDGWRLGLAICTDTGILDHAAATAALGIDVYVAAVLESADDAAVPAEVTRRVAIAHHVFVAVAGFSGSTGGGYDEATGGSGVWRPDGTVIAQAGPETGAAIRSALTDAGRTPAIAQPDAAIEARS